MPPSGSPHTTLWPGRPVTAEETTAALSLAAALDSAADRGKDITTCASTLPPGRISTSALMQADAQRSLGAPVTAAPFARRRRRQRRAPALRLGVGIDHSPSMTEIITTAASAAWVLHRAATCARHLRCAVEMATFDRGASLIRVPDPASNVPQLSCTAVDGRSYDSGAPAVLDLFARRLELLAHPEESRLIVVFTDSAFRKQPAAQHTRRLAAAGVRLLWVSIDEPAPDIAGAVSIASHQLLRRLPELVVDTLARTATPKGFL